MTRIYIYAFFICGVLIAGFVSGFFNMPGAWFDTLAKPPFNPPAWVFAPDWSGLYVMHGWAGSRLFFVRADRPNLFNLWVALFILNLAWSPSFFGLHLPVLAFAVILLMFLGILTFIALSWQRERFSALLFMPIAPWQAKLLTIRV